MAYQKYLIGRNIYSTRHAASLYLGLNERTLDKIKACRLNGEQEHAVIVALKSGYALYGQPFFVGGHCYVSRTHFADSLYLKRSVVDYYLNKGYNLSQIAAKFV